MGGLRLFPSFRRSRSPGGSERPPNSRMEESPEELLSSSHFSQVVFLDVQKFYMPRTDVTCHYSLSPGIVPHSKDWVGIFRVGWKTTREYFTFLWAPPPASDTRNQQIQFKAYYLPKDEEHYQFCYVDQAGTVRGASIPFQFQPEPDEDILLVTTQGELEELQQQNQELQDQLKKTQDTLESLRSRMEGLELELNSLKTENQRLREQGGCREQELQSLREQIQNGNSDKKHLEGRLRTTLELLDQLQSKMSDVEKEVENLSGVEQEKTKELENLKKENQELLQTSAQHHKEAQDVLEQLREQQGLIQALQQEKAKNQKEIQDLQDEKMLLQQEISTLQGLLDPEESPNSARGSLMFGNPYSSTERNLGAEAEPQVLQCPMCEKLFPQDLGSVDFEEHVQSHLQECPICGQTFDRNLPQLFHDHMFCHSLE